MVGEDETKTIRHYLSDVILDGQLIAFGYVTGMGLEHGYMEDIMVHPDYQKRRIGVDLVKGLLREAEQFGLGIVTVTYESHNVNFYQTCGFTPGLGEVWQK
ncbi:GNAT family N-acetyltransferase [Virgibacillus halotolerans]|uniref:GNAT family N-acetyltransferase n=1 Tax=Virgibacillus halotolerans TaxID=1071053 RepID=UPI0030B824FE